MIGSRSSMRLLVAAGLVTLLARSRSARADELTLPSLPTETVVLSNGLRVLLAPDPRASLVAVRVVYDVGLADDPNSKRGLAHLTEHLVSSARSTSISSSGRSRRRVEST